ncbi:flavodoxin family protein [Staphylococcus epidermidis]
MITCLFGSSRKDGNSNIALENMVKDLNVKFINLYQSNIEKVNDNRHSNETSIHNDDYKKILNKVLKSDIIIFSTPLYWYSMSASLKLFIDRWTESLRDTQIDNFKEIMSQKKYLILIIGGDSPRIKAQPLVHQFKLIFEFMNITHFRFLIGEGNKPFDVLNDSQFMEELANTNLALKKGYIYD